MAITNLGKQIHLGAPFSDYFYIQAFLFVNNLIIKRVLWTNIHDAFYSCLHGKSQHYGYICDWNMTASDRWASPLAQHGQLISSAAFLTARCYQGLVLVPAMIVHPWKLSWLHEVRLFSVDFPEVCRETEMSQICTRTSTLPQFIELTSTDRLAETPSPSPPGVFSTWTLRRWTPTLAQEPGHKAAWNSCSPGPEGLRHTTGSRAERRVGVTISCCSNSHNIRPQQPLFIQHPPSPPRPPIHPQAIPM